MQHTDPADANYGYFAWHCKITGEMMGKSPASDGETYFATALFFASKRWGDTGQFNYNAEANLILHESVHKEDGKIQQSVYNMFNTQELHVVFTPYASAAKYTDPSYHLPAFYTVWSVAASSNGAFWSSLANSSRSYFQRTIEPTTALCPDYSTFSGAPTGGSHQQFRFDAWRCAQNIGMDFAWLGGNGWASNYTNTLHRFFAAQNASMQPKGYGQQYQLSGKPLDKDHGAGIVAMNAVAALAATDAGAWAFVRELWGLPVPVGKHWYYNGMLYLLGLLHVAGQFQIWTDTSRPIPLPGPMPPGPGPPEPPAPAPPTVRKTPSWPRSWANFSLLQLYSHWNA